VVRIPFRKITYPTFGKGNHLQNCHFRGYVIVPRRAMAYYSKFFTEFISRILPE